MTSARRVMLKRGIVALVCMMSVVPQWAAAEPTCPESHNEVFQGTLFRASPTAAHAVTMAPCETLPVTFTGTIVGQPAIGLSVQVMLKNRDGVTLASQSSWCYVIAGCGFTMPLPAGYSGKPLPGTAGDAGRVSTLAVPIGNPAYTTVGLDYTTTVSFVPRPGYNSGGTDLISAPLLDTSPATIHGSLHWLEDGQYFRVRVRAGGTLQVTGWVGITCTPCYGGAFSVAVFTAGGTYLATIASRGYGSNYGPTVPFTSSVFTNTTGQPAEFVLRLKVAVTPTPTLAEFALAVTWAEGPRLTLFLDREPNDPVLGFSVAAPASDHATYVPGADRTGASVPVSEGTPPSAQALELIAAYVDDAGAVVPLPPYAGSTVTFALRDTSAFRGYAMNAGESTAPDFSLPTPAAPFGADHTARTALSCHDYGGFTTVTVTDGMATTEGMRLPRALAGDWLPAAGWRSWDGIAVEPAGLSRDQDEDPSPAVVSYPVISYGLVGDRLMVFEEFRGFLVGGSHRRLDPRRKDLFVTALPEYDVGYATNLPVVVHQVIGQFSLSPLPVEHDPAGLISPNFSNALPGGDISTRGQRALRIRPDDTTWSPGYYGQTFPVMPFLAPGDVAETVVFYRTHLEYLTSPTYCGVVPEDPPCHTLEQAKNELRRTIAHEVGHGVGMCHFNACGAVGDSTPTTRASTVMDGTPFLGPPASDPKSRYDGFEQGLIRLHKGGTP